MTNDALVLYVEKSHLEKYNFFSDCRPSSEINGASLEWQTLPKRASTFVTCKEALIINPLLQKLGRGPEFYKELREKFERHLQRNKSK